MILQYFFQKVYMCLRLPCVYSVLSTWLRILILRTMVFFVVVLQVFLPSLGFVVPSSTIVPIIYPSSSLLPSDSSVPPTSLTSNQRKLLHAHQKLGYLNLDMVQYLARSGALGSSIQSAGNCPVPLCHACIHGKQHRHSIPPDSTPIDVSHLDPGDCVSCDQLESSPPGLIPTDRGTPSTSKYHAGTLFVDYASHYLYFMPHVSTDVQEALQAKHTFELHASQYNRFVKCYHADNGIFTTKDFCTHCTHQRQRLTFCGVNAHHQNGITERHIRSITERACSMLIHAMISWPDIIYEQLWPFALQLAVDLHNHTPGSSGLSPLEIISGVKSLSPTIRDFHPFGCPIFVLHPSLQQGHKIPRWKPRSRVGVYLGFSPNHALSVPLVLSITTGLVSPHSMSSTTIFLQQQIVFRPIPFPILGLHY
jgi:hypothetical protein